MNFFEVVCLVVLTLSVVNSEISLKYPYNKSNGVKIDAINHSEAHENYSNYQYKGKYAGSRKSLEVAIYYGTLCPDSRRFLKTQLGPVLQLTQNKTVSSSQKLHPKLLIRLVPYGKAVALKRWPFTLWCQHGELECEGNKLHSCAISKNRGRITPGLLAFLTCTMDYMSTKQTSKLSSTLIRDAAFSFCLKDHRHPIFEEILSCLHGEEANLLVSYNGKLTSNLQPKLYFIPWITFNNRWNKDTWKNSLHNFTNVICNFLPNLCSSELLKKEPKVYFAVHPNSMFAKSENETLLPSKWPVKRHKEDFYVYLPTRVVEAAVGESFLGKRLKPKKEVYYKTLSLPLNKKVRKITLTRKYS